MNEFSVHFQLAPKLPSCPHLFDGRVGIPHSLLRSLIVLLLLCLSWIVKLVFAEAFLVLWTNIAIRSEMIFLHWDFLFFHFFCVECLAFNHHILYLLFSIPKDKQCTSLFSIFFCSFTIRTKIFHSLQNAKKMLSDTLLQIQISLKHWRQRDKTNLWQVSWYKSATTTIANDSWE